MFDRCLYFNLNALTRQVNKIWDSAFEAFDLSPAHAYLLRLVLASPSITQKQISVELQLEKSTVTRFIAVLEKKQLLLRTKSGREQQVFPTKKAKSIASKLEQQGNELYQKMIHQHGKSALVKLVGDLKKASSKLQ